MAKPSASALHRRLLSSAVVPPLLLWALFCVALGSGVAVYLLRASAAATENIYARAEAVAAVAEHTLLRSFEAIQGVHDLLQLRQGLLEAEEAPGAYAIQTHIRRLAGGGRFGIFQVSVTDRDGLVVWGTELAPRACRLPTGNTCGRTWRGRPPAASSSAGRWWTAPANAGASMSAGRCGTFAAGWSASAWFRSTR